MKLWQIIGNWAKKISGRKKSAAGSEAKLEFAAKAKAFSGLYEPLYKIANGKIKFRPGVIGDWAARSVNLEGAQSYVDWQTDFSGFADWTQDEGRKKAGELLSFVLEAGVCRSGETAVTVDGGTYKKYDYADEMIEEGHTASVKSPYWHCGDEILEKGIIG